VLTENTLKLETIVYSK